MGDFISLRMVTDARRENECSGKPKVYEDTELESLLEEVLCQA